MTETGSSRSRLHLFEGYGVELEYMLVRQASLDVFPAVDQLIEAECGRIESEIQVGDIGWSNELVLHVLELKTPQPVPALKDLAARFQGQIRRLDGHLAAMKAALLPSAMHPWMDPDREMRLWPHEYSEVYEAFNRIFDCRGHGWANLQSVHLNLPFAGDEEFGRLHAAVRLILPLLPGLAASSPVMNGRLTGLLDNRLEVYRKNSSRVPSVCGRVIPEQAFSEADYHRLIFQPMFAEIAPLDPDGVLQDEFLNARGAIARFGRGSIEIRVIDIQECPAADLAVLQLSTAVLKALTSERFSTISDQQAMPVEPLSAVLLEAIRHGDQAVIANSGYLKLLGCNGKSSATVGEVWRQLADSTSPETDSLTAPALDVILKHGPLARRIVNRLPADPTREDLKQIYDQLAVCLYNGQSFGAGRMV
ncbi:MAG: glutamate-cysteine ligase family protein [Planctomycetaceae bacterium]